MNQFNLKEHLQLIQLSYEQALKASLPFKLTDDIVGSFNGCPYPIASHTNKPDPLFNYANQSALNLFEVSLDVLTETPSKYSAPNVGQEERQRLLEQVSKHGFIDRYRGIRQTFTGKRFMIEDATVWNLIDEYGLLQGQAVIIFKHEVIGE